MDKNILSMYDEIIVLNNGTIYEKGSFDELISKEGYFYSLYNVTNMVQHSIVEAESYTH